jgi:MFS transporter, DHA2 family, multidrug resistance protein
MTRCRAQQTVGVDLTEQAIERDGMAIPRRYWAYGAVVITLFLAVMDASVANVALPTIANDFHTTPSQSITIVSAYQLTVVILLLPLAALGDIYGYRRVYNAGLIVFTVASFCCAAAWSLDLLTAARILQGLGAAGIMSVNAALIRYIFPTAKLGHALGINTLAVGVASSIGPSFAGFVLAIASWHWLFAVNVPLGIVAYVLGVKTLPDSRRTAQKFDIVSALLSAVMFSMLLGFIDSLSHGGSWPRSVAEVTIGLTAAVWAVRRQADRSAPLLPIDLLKIPIFALSMCTSVCSFCAQMLAFVSLPFMLQSGRGFSPTTVGLLIVPWPLAVAVCAPIAGRLSDRISSAILGFGGLLALVVGLLFMAFLPAHASPANIVWRMVLCGAGFGTFQTPNNRTIVTSAPRIRSGAASGMLGTARLLGQALGAALVALILAHIAGPNGARISLLVGAAFALVAAFISVARYGKNTDYFL